MISGFNKPASIPSRAQRSSHKANNLLQGHITMMDQRLGEDDHNILESQGSLGRLRIHVQGKTHHISDIRAKNVQQTCSKLGPSRNNKSLAKREVRANRGRNHGQYPTLPRWRRHISAPSARNLLPPPRERSTNPPRRNLTCCLSPPNWIQYTPQRCLTLPPEIP